MEILDFLKNDRFASYIGAELLEVKEGSAIARMNIDDRHLNAVSTIHGGAIFSLADFVLAAASNSYGTVAVAINSTISYFRSEKKGTLFAEATETSRTNKIASYSIKITNTSGELVSSFQGMVYLKKDKL
jgi:acyl-CoA thioesterase